MRILVILLLTVALGVSGCTTIRNVFRGTSKDNVDPPVELTEFTQSVAVTKLWSRNLGGGMPKAGLRQSPSLSENRLYAADPGGALYALDAATGAEVWKVDTGLRLGSGTAVGDGLVVVGTLDGKLLAFDAESGRSRWTADLSSEALAAPSIADGIVIARTVDGRSYGFDVTDGKRSWVFDRGVPILSLRGNSAPLVVNSRVLLAYDSGKVAAVDTGNGSLIWEQTLAEGEGRSEIDRTVDIDGDLVAEGSRGYAVAYGTGVVAFDVESGRIAWTRALKSYGGVALSGERLFVADAEGVVWCLNAGDGRVLWKKEGLGYRFLSTPAVVGEYVVVADFEGYVHWLSAKDGAFAARSRVDDKGVRTTPLTRGNTTWVLGNGGEVTAFRVGG